MTELQRVLIQRDGMEPEDAAALIADLSERVYDGENPEELLYEELGLEPDYIFDLIG
jgi:hypothetical protein